MTIKDVMWKFVKNRLEDKGEKNLKTEEDILQAIDALYPESVVNEKSDAPTDNKQEGVNYTKVRTPGCYSKFEYIGQDTVRSFTEGGLEDSRPFFVIPCGLDTYETNSLWFITFPVGGSTDEITEFSIPVSQLVEGGSDV